MSETVVGQEIGLMVPEIQPEEEPKLLSPEVAIAIKERTDLILSYGGSGKRFVSRGGSTSALDIRKRARESDLGDIMLRHGAFLSVVGPQDLKNLSVDIDEFPDFNMRVDDSLLAEVSVTVWRDHYKGDWLRTLGVNFCFQKDADEDGYVDYVNETISFSITPDEPVLPMIHRSLWARRFMEWGYLGHGHDERRAANDQEVLILVDLADEVFKSSL
jgi:hypothetical protein